jgi:hypothetical protein
MFVVTIPPIPLGGILQSIERIARKTYLEHLGPPFLHRFERAQYSDLYLMSQVSEEDVQRSIIETLHFYLVDAIAIDAGMKHARGRLFQAARDQGIEDPRELVKFNGGAIPAGLSDLHATLAPGGVGLFIEVKAPLWIDGRKKIIREAGKASDEQLAFLLSKHERGAIAFVAWSADDVMRVLGDRANENRESLRNL